MCSCLNSLVCTHIHRHTRSYCPLLILFDGPQSPCQDSVPGEISQTIEAIQERSRPQRARRPYTLPRSSNTGIIELWIELVMASSGVIEAMCNLSLRSDKTLKEQSLKQKLVVLEQSWMVNKTSHLKYSKISIYIWRETQSHERNISLVSMDDSPFNFKLRACESGRYVGLAHKVLFTEAMSNVDRSSLITMIRDSKTTRKEPHKYNCPTSCLIDLQSKDFRLCFINNYFHRYCNIQ